MNEREGLYADIDPELKQRVREFAARHKTTMKALVVAGLELEMARIEWEALGPGGHGALAGKAFRERTGLLLACQAAYRKHHLGDESIAWEELGGFLQSTLCEVMGDDGYAAWVKGIMA